MRLHQFDKNFRNHCINNISEYQYDLAIIGGGITGAGVARDAASRGLKVILIEANDFASGTSSRSSKLIHGGIRYLENLEFHLVFEALSERKLLFELAPHLVHPLRFLLPLYKGQRVGMFKMGLGMWLYDCLSLFEAPQMHEHLNKFETQERIPGINNNQLSGSYEYSDAYMDDDRLVHETLRSAHQFGAHCLSYVKATGVEFKNQQKEIQFIECIDKETNHSFKIKAKHFVSTVGPWTDELAKIIVPHWNNIMRLSKGVHLTLSKDRLPIDRAVVMPADSQKRIVFAIPRHEMVILGTTDTEFKGDLNSLKTNLEDADYVIKVTNEYFPGFNISHEDIIGSYAGVRPLVKDGAETEGKTSREHVILSPLDNLTLVAGGKYTTYRHMAEQAVLAVLNHFSLEDQIKFSKSKTKQPLNLKISKDSYENHLNSSNYFAEKMKLPIKIAKLFLERHGEEAEELAKLYHHLDHKMNSLSRAWSAEAIFSIKHTQVFHFNDFMLRRTPLFLMNTDHGFDVLDDVLNVVSNEFKWNSQERQAEKEIYLDHLNRELGWKNLNK